ncbi:hypothetical protein K501DRAFT_6549 [Backusella circina FSU 941]|nr:hypothetical protein K501DRAFT_6549 [Backusella circina FSU 941]
MLKTVHIKNSKFKIQKNSSRKKNDKQYLLGYSLSLSFWDVYKSAYNLSYISIALFVFLKKNCNLKDISLTPPYFLVS